VAVAALTCVLCSGVPGRGRNLTRQDELDQRPFIGALDFLLGDHPLPRTLLQRSGFEFGEFRTQCRPLLLLCCKPHGRRIHRLRWMRGGRACPAAARPAVRLFVPQLLAARLVAVGRRGSVRGPGAAQHSPREGRCVGQLVTSLGVVGWVDRRPSLDISNIGA
jgi:hypothetical protein